MATIYEVEIVSHWVNYSEEELKQILDNAVKEHERKYNNSIQIKVKRKK